MIRKFLAWFARKELAELHTKNFRLQIENEELKSHSHTHLESVVKTLTEENIRLKGDLQKATKFLELKDQLRSHSLFLEKYEAQEKQRTAGLQHVILWAIDADCILEIISQENPEEYRKFRRRLREIFKMYDIEGLSEQI